ncbi:hypothetical protein FRC11_004888 [Ceratobasidium sp. 423]|nr:hypothetical protein FRC11_004888 [Ceratobasidium sp. 423]
MPHISGSVTVPPSEHFIAIATLENTLVIYSLDEGGPVIDTRFEVSSQEQNGYCPVLPIMSTSSNLVFKGTIVGDIEVLDQKTCLTALLHHDWRHIDELQGPIFEIALSSILPFSERIKLRNPLGMLNMVHAAQFNIRWWRGAILLLISAAHNDLV